MKIVKHLLLLPLFLLSDCLPNDPVIPDNKPNLKPLSTAEVNVSAANNDFAFDLFRDIQKQNVGSNVFISPVSVSMALGMTLNGASASTQQSILNTIRFGNLKPKDVDQAYEDLITLLTSMDRTVEIDLANSVWYNKQYTVIDTFATEIQNYYRGTVQGLDFSDPSSSQVINSWVANNTHQEIKNLIDGITPDETMFLVNAIYFKGTWTFQFDPSQTQAATFAGEDGSFHQVQMMFAKKPTLTEFVHDGFIVVNIPYGNGQFSMTVLLPNPGTTVQHITDVLSADSLNVWLNKADTVSPELLMPKFKMEWKSDLKNNLQDLGMATTGFPHLFEQPLSLAITHVFHQASINVDESGSEASAATGVAIGVTSLPGPPPRIEINRPFIYFIREKHSGVILFMGQFYIPPTN